jgi:hopene-associated glycosyltransferase HpnB
MLLFLWTVVALGLLSLGSWVYLVLSRERFWETDIRLDERARFRGPWPNVAVLVPARDETGMLPQTLPSLLNQDYPSDYQVFVIDDGSSDGTADTAMNVARLEGMAHRIHVTKARPAPEGWRGKVWALQQGLNATVGHRPRFLLLTDADILHPPDNLRKMVAKALDDELDVVSIMARLRAQGLWERLLMPAFSFFFSMLFPFRWVASPDKPTAAAAGGCLLVRRAALERAGGFRAISGALIDDVALAKAVKGSGGALWLGHSGEVRSIRAYGSLGAIWGMVARSAYDQLGYSPLNLLGTIAVMTVIFLAPPVVALTGAISMALNWPGSEPEWAAIVVGVAAWETISSAYISNLRLYGQHREHGLLMPFVALLYMLMTISAAVRHHLGRSPEWKGRKLVSKTVEPGEDE